MEKKKKSEILDQYDYVDDEYIRKTSPDYIQAIGHFVLEFSALEHLINLGIADQINDRAHFPGYQVVELLTTKNKIELLSRLIGSYLYHMNSKKQEKFKNLISRLRELNSFRNKVLHANWMSASKNGTVRTKIIVKEHEGAVKFERAKLTPQIIDKNSKDCSKTRVELEKFIADAVDFGLTHLFEN